MKKKNQPDTGFTIIELMLTIALSAMVVSYLVYVFEAGLGSWIYGETQMQIQQEAAQAIDLALEGSDRYDGLREVLDIVYAGETEIGYIPWWEQKVRFIEPRKKIKLNLPYNAVGGVPVAQFYDTEKGEYRFTEIDFYSGKDELDENFVSYRDDMLKGKKGRIFFYPEYQGNPDVMMTLYWDKETHKLMRHYRDKLEPLTRNAPETQVSNFFVEYLDGSNSVIPMSRLKEGQSSLQSIHALRMFLTVSRESEDYTLRSFVGIRKKGIAGSGIFLTEGSDISIPDSKKIKTLSLIHFSGVKDKSRVYCILRSAKETKSYGLKVFLGLKNDIPWLERYEVEYPRGKMVYAYEPDQPASYGINLLTIDYSGRYDYNSDQDIPGQVEFMADDVRFELADCDITGIQVLIR